MDLVIPEVWDGVIAPPSPRLETENFSRDHLTLVAYDEILPSYIELEIIVGRCKDSIWINQFFWEVMNVGHGFDLDFSESSCTG